MITDSYTPIFNEVLEALAQVNLSPYETRVLFAVWRKTYGFIDASTGQRKKFDYLAGSQIAQITKLDRRLVSRALQGLIKKQILCRDGRQLGFCKKFMQHLSSVAMTNVISSDDKDLSSVAMTPVISSDDNLSSVAMHTKERKETIKKKETLSPPNVINQAKIKKGATSHSNTSHSIESHSKKGLYPCAPDEIHKIATDLNISVHDVRAKHDRIMDLIDTNEFKPKWGKTTYGVLRNWLRRDKEDGRLTPMSWEEQQVLQYESPKWQKTFAEMRETMKKMREGSP